MTTIFQLPSGKQTDNYQVWRDAKAAHEAAENGYQQAFGQHMADPAKRAQAVAAFNVQESMDPANTVHIATPAGRYKAGLTAAKVDQFVKAGDRAEVVTDRAGNTSVNIEMPGFTGYADSPVRFTP